MEAEHIKYRHLRHLICELIDGSITPDRMAELNQFLANDPEAVKHYVDFMDVQVLVELNMSNSSDVLMPLYAEEVQNLKDLWHELSEEEKTAPAVEIPKEQQDRELIQKVVYPPRTRRTISKFQIFTLMMSAAAILFFVLFIEFTRPGSNNVATATLVDQMNAQWSNGDTMLGPGDRLSTNGDILELRKGLAKLQYDDGVDVLVEGPAAFQIERSGIYLEYGRLYSCVSEAGKGFRVETPTSQFIDLGTEFGVQADVNGSSELHVTKGKVQLYAGAHGHAKVSQLLSENSAARYDASTEQVKSIPIRKTSFVRTINSKSNLAWRGQEILNLADVVGGGDGFGSGSRDRWIDVVEAKYFQGAQFNLDEKSRANRYRPFDAHPFIDGVFIPNGQSGPLQVSSAGHEFKDCPITSGTNWNGIFNSNSIDRLEGVDTKKPKNDLILDGVKYNTLSKPSVNIHANQGITFDLNAIRNQIQGSRISRFTARAGISQSILDLPPESFKEKNGDKILCKASFYVLIDGEVRCQGVDYNPRNPSLDIQIDLSPSDRFLTLIASEGSGETIQYDWVVFAEPFLHLE